MTLLDAKDYTGYSENSLDEAIADALQKADHHHQRFEVIETRSSQFPDNAVRYHVTLTAFIPPTL